MSTPTPQTVREQTHGDVVVITLDNPPVNSMGFATRVALAEALARAQQDAVIRAIVLTGAGKAFSGGADIGEFGTDLTWREPNLHSLIAMVEGSAKPVVAALHSTVMGGGLELALGCHHRVVVAGTQVALPEVKLGLLPGAGGTQRLPRALGVEAALNMIVSGEPRDAALLARVPGQRLFDAVVDDAGALLDTAMTLARKAAQALEAGEASALPRVRDWPARHPQGEAFFQFARNTAGAMAPGLQAPLHCIDAVEAATQLPFDQGFAKERELFMNLMGSSQSRALRHLFFAERAASKIDDVPPDTPTREIRKVAVIGAGTMGGGIAMNFLNAGIPVVLLETKPEALERGVATMRKNYEQRIAKGKLKPEKYEQTMALLTPTLDAADLADADLAIEAVFEDMEVKKQVFTMLDATLKPGAILASNTSTLDLNRIAAFTQRPQDVVGLHFFSPANVMKLLEVVRGEKTARDVLATAMQLAKKIKKVAVIAGVTDGFIGNRMIEPYIRQAGFLLDEGASPEQVDAAIEKFGFAMGPFRMSDLAGNDIAWAIRKRRAAERPELRFSKTADLLCEMGRFGQKTGAGWYDYPSGRRDAVPSAQVQEMIAQHRQREGLNARKIGDDEIVQRLVYALINEGARILEEGFAQRSGDIDLVYLYGYGFPYWRGGPMHYANEVGLHTVIAAMRRFARNPLDDADFWQPAQLLLERAAQGKPL